MHQPVESVWSRLGIRVVSEPQFLWQIHEIQSFHDQFQLLSHGEMPTQPSMTSRHRRPPVPILKISAFLIFIVETHTTGPKINTLQLWRLHLSIGIFWFFHFRADWWTRARFIWELHQPASSVPLTKKPVSNNGKTPRTEPAGRQQSCTNAMEIKAATYQEWFSLRNQSWRDGWKYSMERCAQEMGSRITGSVFRWEQIQFRRGRVWRGARRLHMSLFMKNDKGIYGRKRAGGHNEMKKDLLTLTEGVL